MRFESKSPAEPYSWVRIISDPGRTRVCSACGSMKMRRGYGTAGGGIGTYAECMDCGAFFKALDTEED